MAAHKQPLALRLINDQILNPGKQYYYIKT